MSIKNSLSAYCSNAYELTKTLYRCTYAPQARTAERREEIIEKKCLQMREVLQIKPKAETSVEETVTCIRLSFELMKLLPKTMQMDTSNINNEDAYQEVLTILAANSTSKKSAFHLILLAISKPFGIVNYVKNCPNLFFNDLIKEVVRSDFSVKDKLYVINMVLNCYAVYINRCITAYCLDNNNDPATAGPKALFNILNEHIVDTESYRQKTANEGEDPNYKMLRVNEGDLLSFKGLLVNELETLMQSYKTALSSLRQLSKDYSWKECLNDIKMVFRVDHSVEYISILFKLISSIPDCGLKDRLYLAVINYSTFVKFNTDWKFCAFCMHAIFLNTGSHTWLNFISNRYVYTIAFLAYLSFAVTSAMIASFAQFHINFKELKMLDEALMFSKVLFPLLYIGSVIGNCYALGKLVYS